MIFIATPLLLAALLALGLPQPRLRPVLLPLIVALAIGALLTAWGIVHMVYGDRSSALARAIFARPWLPPLYALLPAALLSLQQATRAR